MFDDATCHSFQYSFQERGQQSSPWQIRPFQAEDAPALLELLRLQDSDASLRTMAPDARTVDDLLLELGECSPYSRARAWVLYEEGGLQAFVQLGEFQIGEFQKEHFLEGPLCHPTISEQALVALLEQVKATAMQQGYAFVEAFADVENKRVRHALRQSGFAAFHTTHLYRYSLKERIKEARSLHVRLEQRQDIQPKAYRQMYRDTSAQWSRRLHWHDERLKARFKDVRVQLWLAYQQLEPSLEDTQAILADMTFNRRLADLFSATSSPKGRSKAKPSLLGHVEIEHHPALAEVELAYFGVLPTARQQGVGRLLVQHGLHRAYQLGARSVTARAHDDERAACMVLERLGFVLERSVLAFTLDL